jgi:hypothetical protein
LEFQFHSKELELKFQKSVESEFRTLELECNWN